MILTTEIFQLPQLPSMLPAYRRAVTSALTRSQSDGDSLPSWEVRVASVPVSPQRLDAYRAVCGLLDAPTLPITYPQVLAGSLHMHVMSRPGFPFPMMGLVHVANEIEQLRPIASAELLDLRVRLGELRRVRRGYEFDLLTEVESGGDLVWRSRMSILRMTAGDGVAARDKRPVSAPVASAAHYLQLDAPRDIGRRYARVSGDYNPIHLSAPSARLFGFPRAIAHGMWTLARCLALLSDGRQVSRLDVQFKKPLLLPGRAALRYEPGEEIAFLLLGRAGRIHLQGRLR